MSAKTSLELLRDHGLVPKKSFGQNFLQDARLCDRIAALATTPPGGTVLEIGAGLGALTRALLARARRVVAVERDRDLVPILRTELADAAGLEIVEADAVRLDWEAILGDGPRPHVVAGNLPYQITGRLVQRVVRAAPHIDGAVLTVQREVADRLVAAPGSGHYGVASVFVQAAFAVSRPLRLAAGAFVPMPQVDSAVMLFVPRRPPLAEESELFRLVVKRAFAQRRKTLRNAWRSLPGVSRTELERLAVAAGIDLDARAETLAVAAFAAMAGRIDRV